MSDLRPEGAVLHFDGADRRLIWDYGVIEKVQEIYGGHPFLALQSIFWSKTLPDGTEASHYMARPVIDLVYILLNNEVEREKFFHGKSDLKAYTRAQVGFLIDRRNADEVVKALMESWRDSVVADEGDEDGDGTKNA